MVNIYRHVHNKDQREEDPDRKSEAYLTVYLSLVLAVLIPLVLALIEGSRNNAILLEGECITDIAMSSILAEYHRELAEQYNLFVIDSSYGNRVAGIGNVQEHLKMYLEGNLMSSQKDTDEKYWDFLDSGRDFLALSLESAKITGVVSLTDNKGEIFRKKAAEAILDDWGWTMLRDLNEWIQTVEANDLSGRDVEAQREETRAELDAFDGTEVQIAEDKWETVDVWEENPTSRLEELQSRGILEWVLAEDVEVSEHAINKKHLISSRLEEKKAFCGNLTFSEDDFKGPLTEKLLFLGYLSRYLGCFGKEEEENALVYQKEYIIAGKESDAQNLKSVVYRLSALREAANALYLFADNEKREQAKWMASGLAAVVLLPQLIPVFQTSILLAWAYAESLYDTKVLLSGGKIPLIKDKGSWHYSLESALALEDVGTKGEIEGSSDTDGLTYEDYLLVLMALADSDDLTNRAMDMVEADIRMKKGNELFCLDTCFVNVEADIFLQSAYGYHYSWKRKMGY